MTLCLICWGFCPLLRFPYCFCCRTLKMGNDSHLFASVLWPLRKGVVGLTFCWAGFLILFFNGNILLNCCHFLEPNTKGHQIGSRSAINWTLWMSSQIAPVAGTYDNTLEWRDDLPHGNSFVLRKITNLILNVLCKMFWERSMVCYV